MRNRWKVRIDWAGADVLVVAPTGMGKVGCLMLQCGLAHITRILLERLLSSPCDRPSCSYTLFVPINEAYKLKIDFSLVSLLSSLHY